MAMIDKIQGTFEKLTADDKRMNSAEITTIQQSFNALQLGFVKIEAYLQMAESNDVKNMLKELRDDFVKPNLDKPQRMLEKAGIPYLNLNPQDRVANVPKTNVRFLTDNEIVLDTVLSMQATITGLQAGALAAVRGDVRDYFLNARDAAFDQWRKIGQVAYRTMPQAIPPTMSGIQ